MKSFSRRVVLRGLGALISLPGLEGCTSIEGLVTAPSREQARQALGGAAKRFVGLICPNGVYPPDWFPTGGERSFRLGPANEPFASVKQHLLLFKGISNKVALDSVLRGAQHGNGHAEGVQSLLTGWGVTGSAGNIWQAQGGPSIDQLLANHFAAQGYVGRSRGIHLGDESPGSYNAISVRANLERESLTDIGVLFDSAGAAQAVERARMRNRSVLDRSKADFEKLKRRVSGVDLQRVESHLEALRSIEQRLALTNTCGDPQLPAPMNGDQKRDMQFDILAAGFACDAARTATVSFFHSGGGGPQLPWLQVNEDIHELSHQVEVASPAPASVEMFAKYHRWFSQKTVRFVEKLKSTLNAQGGSLFDDTVIFQGSEMAIAHRTYDMPFLILAGDRTRFDTGRFVEFNPRVMHSALLTTILHAFGVAAERVGDPQYPAAHLDSRLLKVI